MKPSKHWCWECDSDNAGLLPVDWHLGSSTGQRAIRSAYKVKRLNTCYETETWRLAIFQATVFYEVLAVFEKDQRRRESQLGRIIAMSKHDSADPAIIEVKNYRVPNVVSEEEDVFKGSNVPTKYRGTAADQHDMAVLGKKQVLRRNFRFVTMLGFASTVMAAWEIFLVVAIYSLEDGGTAIIFWGMIAGCIGNTFVYASLAEMVSSRFCVGLW
jgi:hypothetical protein